MGKNVLESSKKKKPREKAREKKKKKRMRVAGMFLNEGEKENKIRGG